MANLRSASIKVNVTPEVYARLKQLADRQGQVPSVLAAVAVGQYVSAHSAPIEMQEKMLGQVMEMVERLPQQLLDLEDRRAPLLEVPAKVRRR